jgi:hypothetical protein
LGSPRLSPKTSITETYFAANFLDRGNAAHLGSGVDGINSSLAHRQMMCVSINTTTTSGTPSNQRMTGMFASIFQLHQ